MKKGFLGALMSLRTSFSLFETDDIIFSDVFHSPVVPGITPWLTSTKKVPSSFSVLPLFASNKGTMMSTFTAS